MGPRIWIILILAAINSLECIGGCDNGDQNTHVTLDIERSNDGMKDSVDIRCSANKTSLIYHMKNIIVIGIVEKNGRNVKLTDGFYPSRVAIDQFQSGHYRMNFQQNQDRAYEFVLHITNFGKEDEGQYKCVLLGCKPGYIVDSASTFIKARD